jgi:hypothetical protein
MKNRPFFNLYPLAFAEPKPEKRAERLGLHFSSSEVLFFQKK